MPCELTVTLRLSLSVEKQFILPTRGCTRDRYRDGDHYEAGHTRIWANTLSTWVDLVRLIGLTDGDGHFGCSGITLRGAPNAKASPLCHAIISPREVKSNAEARCFKSR